MRCLKNLKFRPMQYSETRLVPCCSRHTYFQRSPSFVEAKRAIPEQPLQAIECSTECAQRAACRVRRPSDQGTEHPGHWRADS